MMSTQRHGLGCVARALGRHRAWNGNRPGAGAFARRLPALALALCLAGVGLPRLGAEVITQHFTWSGDPANPSTDFAFLVSQYNLGASAEHLALQHVDFVLSATITGTVRLENTNTGYAQSVNVSYSTRVTLSQAAMGTIAQVFPDYAMTQALAVYDGSTDYGGTSGVTLSASDADTAYASTALAADLTRFSGAGTVSLSGTALNEVLWTTLAVGDKTGLLESYNNANVAVDLWVIYHTPEPGSLCLLGFGAAGLLCQRRRRHPATVLA